MGLDWCLPSFLFPSVCLIIRSLTQGNVGLIFTKGDLKEVSEEVAKYKVKWSLYILLYGCVSIMSRLMRFVDPS